MENVHGLQHMYTLVATGTEKRIKDGLYLTRSEATKVMYQLIEKLNLHLVKKYEDNHDITYVCNDDVKFHINRYM